MKLVGSANYPQFISSFDSTLLITPNNYVVSAFAQDNFTGGHAELYVEELEDDITPASAIATMIHLTASHSGKVYINIHVCQTYNAIEHKMEHFAHENLPDWTPATYWDDHDGRARTYRATRDQVDRVKQAAHRFRNKNVNANRYYYSLPGGLLGRIGGGISTLGNKRGVNCADFLIKILNESGLAHRKSLLFNMPSRIARPRRN